MLEVAVNYVKSLEDILRLIKEMIHAMVNHLKSPSVGQELLHRAIYADCDQAHPRQVTQMLLDRWDLLLTSGWPMITHADAVELRLKATVEGNINVLEDALARIRLERRTRELPRRPLQIPSDSLHISQPKRDSPRLSSRRTVSRRTMALIRARSDIRQPKLSIYLYRVLPKSAVAGYASIVWRLCRRLCATKASSPETSLRPRAPSATQYPGLLPNESLEPLEWFADLRRWGTAQHAGFRIGFERLLMYLTGVASLTDVVPFPRYPGVCGC